MSNLKRPSTNLLLRVNSPSMRRWIHREVHKISLITRKKWTCAGFLQIDTDGRSLNHGFIWLPILNVVGLDDLQEPPLHSRNRYIIHHPPWPLAHPAVGTEFWCRPGLHPAAAKEVLWVQPVGISGYLTAALHIWICVWIYHDIYIYIYIYI